MACVTRVEIDAYFHDGDRNCITLADPVKFAKPISLVAMRAKWQLEPPQQWRYVDGKTFDEIAEAGR
jgi:predicted transcriptional regulator